MRPSRVATPSSKSAPPTGQPSLGITNPVATDLPGLIRNLHTTLATGADHGELLGLAVYLHVHVPRLWLSVAAAPTDLLRRTVFLAKRLAQELEVGESDHAVSIAQDVDPKRHPFPANRAYYWVHYGRALAQLRDRRDDAVLALRTAEDLYPTKVRRDPIVRDVIAELLSRSRRNAVGQELRRMAFRAGLPE